MQVSVTTVMLLLKHKRTLNWSVPRCLDILKICYAFIVFWHPVKANLALPQKACLAIILVFNNIKGKVYISLDSHLLICLDTVSFKVYRIFPQIFTSKKIYKIHYYFIIFSFLFCLTYCMLIYLDVVYYLLLTTSHRWLVWRESYDTIYYEVIEVYAFFHILEKIH